MQIIGTLSSPFTRKVRIVARECDIAVDFKVESPLAEKSFVSRVNPLSKVPVLTCDGKSSLIDSSLIAQFLNEVGKGPNLLGENPPDRMEILQWEAMADGILEAAVLTRMETLRPQNQQSDAWIRRQRAKMKGGMDWFEREVGKADYCVGGSFSLADIAVGCCIAYLNFRFSDGRWYACYPNVARMSEYLEQRESFRATTLRP